MSPCSRMLRCFRPPRSSSSVARLMPFWPGGTGQARCGFEARWFYLNTCLRLHAPLGTNQLVFPLCGFPSVPRVSAHGAIRGEGALSSRGSGFGTGAGRLCHQGSLLSRPARLDASMDLLLLQPYRTPYSAENFVPTYLWEFQQKVPGDFDLSPLQTFQSEVLYYMRHWILGSPHGLWSNPFRRYCDLAAPSGSPSPEDSCPSSTSWMVGILNQRRVGVSSSVLRLW